MKPQRLFLIPLLLILSACAALGLQTPNTYTERATYVEDGLAAVVKSTNESLKAHAISSAEAKSVRATVVEIQNYLDLANEAFGNGDFSTAESRIAIAITVLKTLQSKVKP